MKRSVLLLRVESPEDRNQFFPPYGLLYISAAIEKIGIQTKIFHDYESEKLLEEVLDYIEKNNPIWVGFSVITNKGLKSSLNFTRAIKRKYPTVPIVWGGIHPTMCSEQTLKEHSIDFIIVSEGEIAAQKLTRTLLEKKSGNQKFSKIEGLGYKKQNKLIINKSGEFIKNLDEFVINFEKIDVNKYVFERMRWKGRSFPLITSRGCPFSCRFCYNQVVNKQRWRAHSPDYVKGQMEFLTKKYGIINYLFYDDNFFVDRHRGLEIVKNVPNEWMAEIRANYFSNKFVKKIREGGCIHAFIGVESGNDRVLREIINKRITKRDMTNAIILSKKHNLNIGLSFIIGFPGEKRKEMFDTLDYIYKISKVYPSANIDLHIFKPYPGTPLYYESLKLGLGEPKKIDEWASEKYYQEKANNPWVNDQKELENIRDIFSLYILLHKKRGNTYDILRTISFLEIMRIKVKFYKFPLEVKLFNFIKQKLTKNI